MPFFHTKDKSFYKLSISLKSSSIDLQLIKINESGIREVLFFERNIILLENSQDPTLYTNQYVKELTILFEKNHTKIKQLAQNKQIAIHFVLFSPWFTSSINTLTQIEPVTIDEKFLSKKIEQFSLHKKLTTLEKRVIKIQANGYSLDNITDIKSGDVHLQTYSSYISQQIQSLLIKNVQKYFTSSKEISYTTSPLLMFDAIKKFMVKEDNITFVHIGGEITELGIIKDDSLDYFTTFPIGIHDFLREIQSSMKTYDYDLLYQKEIQIKSVKAKNQFESLKNNWKSSVNTALTSFGKNVPNKIIIITDQKTNEFFTKILSDSIKADEQESLKNHRIINFDISMLKDIILYKTPIGENELDLKLQALI